MVPRNRREAMQPKTLAMIAISALVVLYWMRQILVAPGQGPSKAGSSADAAASLAGAGSKSTAPLVVHNVETYINGEDVSLALVKPLEKTDANGVTCPEKNGRNTQCCKTSAVYHLKGAEPFAQLYLYVHTIAPSLNDNSLWVGQVGDSHFTTCKSDETAGPLVPHKHVTSSKRWLCCPAYLAKNKKKGLTSFYSECCYNGLGPKADQEGCVLDLELSEEPQWNQATRVFVADDKGQLAIRVFFREDGTTVSGLVVSKQNDLDAEGLGRILHRT